MMKYAILFIIIFFILLFFKFFKYSVKQKKENIKEKDKIIDLEKDPNTDDYIPRE